MFIEIFPRIPKAHPNFLVLELNGRPSRVVRSPLIFPSKTWFFAIYLNFQWQKSLKIQYLPHPKSKSEERNFIKSSHQDLSNNTKGTSQLLWNFLSWFNWIFSEKFIQYSRTSTPQIETIWNQANAPLLVKSLPKTSRMQSEMPQFGRSHNEKQTKQTKFLHTKMACRFWQAWKARVKIWKCSIKFLKNQ